MLIFYLCINMPIDPLGSRYPNLLFISSSTTPYETSA